VPVVYAYAPSDDPTDLSLTPDNELGGRLAAEHLISCGRVRIGWMLSISPTRLLATGAGVGATGAWTDAGRT